jgi:hypothetical protein
MELACTSLFWSCLLLPRVLDLSAVSLPLPEAMSDSQSVRATSAVDASKLESGSSAASEKPGPPASKDDGVTQTVDEYPEGGLRAWVTIAGSYGFYGF